MEYEKKRIHPAGGAEKRRHQLFSAVSNPAAQANIAVTKGIPAEEMTALASVISNAAVAISNKTIYPLLTFLSAGLVIAASLLAWMVFF